MTFVFHYQTNMDEFSFLHDLTIACDDEFFEKYECIKVLAQDESNGKEN